ncbi:hypothetical protein QOZ80_6BG0497350 [Eleusine coracana subsp. coracana]|nr:hypothetical protein QOZ80_6BG0497350 [Eleusine coracana subsp. coracana]
MGRSLLILVALSVVLQHGTNATRSHPKSKDVVPEFHARLNNTHSIPWLVEEVSPHQGSDNALVYFASYAATTAPEGYYGSIGTMDVTGCMNMKCIGFQPEKGAKVAPGDVIDHVTFPKQKAKRNLNLKVIKDGSSGDWLVHCGIDREPELIGRFPRSLFTGGFVEKATSVSFGGVTIGPITNPPPMGSGYLPMDATSAASISNIQLIDQNGHAWPVTQNLPKLETNRVAYAVSPIVNGQFFYGGHEQPPTA